MQKPWEAFKAVVQNIGKNARMAGLQHTAVVLFSKLVIHAKTEKKKFASFSLFTQKRCLYSDKVAATACDLKHPS